jgi:hypothetical protein
MIQEVESECTSGSGQEGRHPCRLERRYLAARVSEPNLAVGGSLVVIFIIIFLGFPARAKDEPGAVGVSLLALSAV